MNFAASLLITITRFSEAFLCCSDEHLSYSVYYTGLEINFFVHLRIWPVPKISTGQMWNQLAKTIFAEMAKKQNYLFQNLYSFDK